MAFAPRAGRETRVWNYLNRQLDWYRLSAWPVWIAKLALKEHKTNRDRYSLFFFWTVNGMNPDQAGALLLVTDVEQGRYTQTYGYDPAAMRQVAQMVRQCLDGTLFPNGKRYWNMAYQQVMRVGEGPADP